VRDPFAVACKAQDSLGWPEKKALLLVVAQEPDGEPAASYAAQLAAVLGVDEDTQESIYREAVEHRAHLEGTTTP
jgi:hypothetical protein